MTSYRKKKKSFKRKFGRTLRVEGTHKAKAKYMSIMLSNSSVFGVPPSDTLEVVEFILGSNNTFATLLALFMFPSFLQNNKRLMASKQNNGAVE